MGCGQVTQLTTVYADGSRSYSYAITLDDEILEQYSIDKDTAMQLIDTSARTYWAAFSANRHTSGVNFSSGVSESNANVYQIMLTFATFTDYCLFMGTTPEEVAKQPAVIKEGLFVSQNVIADSELDSSDELLLEMYLVPSLIDGISTAFANTFFDGDKTTTDALFDQIDTYIVRAYATSLGIKSNADETASLISNYGVHDEQLMTYTAHLWHCTFAEPTPHIYIYQNVYTNANRIAWYILGIGLAIIFGAILFVVLYVKHKRNPDDTNQAQPETVILDATATPFAEYQTTDTTNVDKSESLENVTQTTNEQIENKTTENNADTDNSKQVANKIPPKMTSKKVIDNEITTNSELQTTSDTMAENSAKSEESNKNSTDTDKN